MGSDWHPLSLVGTDDSGVGFESSRCSGDRRRERVARLIDYEGTKRSFLSVDDSFGANDPEPDAIGRVVPGAMVDQMHLDPIPGWIESAGSLNDEAGHPPQRRIAECRPSERAGGFSEIETSVDQFSSAIIDLHRAQASDPRRIVYGDPLGQAGRGETCKKRMSDELVNENCP